MPQSPRSTTAFPDASAGAGSERQRTEWHLDKHCVQPAVSQCWACKETVLRQLFLVMEEKQKQRDITEGEEPSIKMSRGHFVRTQVPVGRCGLTPEHSAVQFSLSPSTRYSTKEVDTKQYTISLQQTSN